MGRDPIGTVLTPTRDGRATPNQLRKEGMALTIVEVARGITGGVDTHRDTNVAAALDPIGGVLGTDSFRTTAAGNRELLEWLRSFGDVVKVGVEGTGTYGSQLARFLAGEGVTVLEVNRPNRQERRRAGKSDPLDAVEAARAALSGKATAIANGVTATLKRSAC